MLSLGSRCLLFTNLSPVDRPQNHNKIRKANDNKLNTLRDNENILTTNEACLEDLLLSGFPASPPTLQHLR